MRIHFIGIGGIGVSSLAQHYIAKGQIVSGSDLASSEITDFLKGLGAHIFIGPHSANNIPKGTEMIIYSPAVNDLNPELKKAKDMGILVYSYPEALGRLTKKNFTIAVSGTHGKSTTTAMISLIMAKAGLDPNVIIGTKVNEFGKTNFRPGKSRYLVIESDEWQASFLNYWPRVIVLTNIEREHLDYYKNLNHILKTFNEYISHIPNNGVLVWNKEDENIKKLSNVSKLKNIGYSLRQKDAKKLKKILRVPGEHNVSNALAALTVARFLEIPDKISFQALSEYKGAWRRFETKRIKLAKKEIIVVNDYGHHPTEVEKTLEAAREKYGDSKIICVFQPHQIQRTFLLFNDFVKVFKEASIDQIIITDIYDVAGREKKELKVSSQELVKKIKKQHVIYLSKDKIIDYLSGIVKNKDVIIVMGAGDIYRLL